MTYFCPSCDHACEQHALECTRCGADFRSEGAWKPVPEAGLVQNVSPKKPLGWLLIFLAIVVLGLAAFFTFTCKPGACSAAPLGIVILIGGPLLIVGVEIVRGKI
jgi:hypothetical protein